MPVRLKSNIAGVMFIAPFVGLAFLINGIEPTISPLALCLVFGFATSHFNLWPSLANHGSAFASKTLLRLGVALLGFQVSFSTLNSIGFKGAITVILVVSFTIFGVLLLSRLFHVTNELGLLIGVGFGICGATAVAAVRPQTRATEEETSYAIALITLCGTLSVVVLPFLGHLMHLTDTTFGAWVGAAVHDVGQVIATASVWSPTAITSAIVIKLARVCLLAPIVLILTLRHRKYLKSMSSAANEATHVPFVPLFVLGFIAVTVFHNSLEIPANLLTFLVFLSKVLIGFGLVALGSGVRWRSIRAIGPRPMAMGLCAWLIVAGVSLFAVRVTGI